MGSFGYHVIDADGHGGESADWRENVPGGVASRRLAEYRDRIAKHYAQAGAAGRRHGAQGRQVRHAPGHDRSGRAPEGHGPRGHRRHRQLPRRRRRGVGDARPRLRHRALPDDERRQGASSAAHAPKRLKAIAKLPMIDPPAAAAELRRAVTELGLVGMVTPAAHPRQEPQRPELRRRLGARPSASAPPVCVHGGGQAPDQYPIGVDRYNTRLEVHAMTHPMGNMLALMSMHRSAASSTASPSCASASWSRAAAGCRSGSSASTSTTS